MAKTSAFTTLLVKNGRDDLRTIANVSPVPMTENNLADWFVRFEITNTGVSKTNSGTLTLRIDALGTFIRSGPILVDEATKNAYLIEMQLKQDLDNDGDFSEPNEQGIVLRGIIGQPQISIDETFGEVLRINLVGIEYRIKETLTSEDHRFISPNESFTRRLNEVTTNATGVRFSSITNSLPTSPILSFQPFNPTKVHDTLTEIIDLLALPQVAGGSFDDFYFDIEPNATQTNHLTLIAEKFGNTNSGVIINPLSINVFDTDEEQTVITDNIEYKNHVIIVGSGNGGSLPVERTRFASNFEHAKIRDEWSGSSVSYTLGDLVQHKTTTALKPHLVTYHTAKTTHTSTGGQDPITTSGTLWTQDFTVYPPFITTSGTFYRVGEIITHSTGGVTAFYQCNAKLTYPITHFSSITPPAAPTGWTFLKSVADANYTAFVTYTPWTNDVDLWKNTLAGATNLGISGGVGWAFDWNITKANYNREDQKSSFEPVSPKWVTSINNLTQPSNSQTEVYDGQRFLLGASPTGTDWAGNGNKIAERFTTNEQTVPVTGEWKFSVSPVNSDVVSDLATAHIYQFNGTIWGSIWDPLSVDDTDKPSPFHLCNNVGLVAGATGISGQAVEFTYDWFVNPLDLLNTHFHRTSRGVWISQSFPIPRLPTTNFDTGALYGGAGGSVQPIKGTFNTNNMDVNRKGVRGWNQGINSEDMGKISAIKFKMRVSMFRNSGGTSLVEGQPDVPMTFWATDKFDRVWYAKFKLRRNGQWDDVRISVGDFAQNQLYFARWDELAKLNNGVTITELDFTLAEKEFSGVLFDWKFVKHWGVQLDESYVETGLYKNGLQRAFEYGEDISNDLQSSWFWSMLGPTGVIIKNSLPQHTPVTQNFIRLSAKIALDDLHFEKEQIVTSDNTAKTDPRTVVEHISTESDYLNLKDRAIGSESRKRFFPQFWHIRATGDVRLRFGHKFTVTNSRVNTGSQEMVVSEVKHIYDHDGYHIELAGIRKFTVSG